MTEFELIKHYFTRQIIQRPDVLIGVGDDAAIIESPQHDRLVFTTDTLIAGVHFPENTSAYDIGYKALAVNLSDLAAMGATPAWMLLSLTIPEADEDWLHDFSSGLFTLAGRYHVQLIGGDTTRGPLSINIQAIGVVPESKALLRSGAKVGDLIYVTGTLGDAGFALQKLKSSKPDQEILNRLNRPEPRIATGILLGGNASSAIDISDGLVADLGHILSASLVGATVNVNQLPLSNKLKNLPQAQALDLALNSGDDYELCFTLPPSKREIIEKLADPCTLIGEITKDTGIDLRYQDGNRYDGKTKGYQHF